MILPLSDHLSSMIDETINILYWYNLSVNDNSRKRIVARRTP